MVFNIVLVSPGEMSAIYPKMQDKNKWKLTKKYSKLNSRNPWNNFSISSGPKDATSSTLKVLLLLWEVLHLCSLGMEQFSDVSWQAI